MEFCEAVPLKRIVRSRHPQFEGKVLPEDHYWVKDGYRTWRGCTNKGRYVIERDGVEFHVCGTHNNDKVCVTKAFS